MTRPRNGRDWTGLIAVILAATLALCLLATVVALLFFDAELSEEGARLLSGIGLALAGALATYIGMGRQRGGGDQ